MKTVGRKVASGTEFDRYFKKAKGESRRIKKNADLSDTMRFIPWVVSETLDQTREIAKELKRATVYETCKAVFDFTWKHISYRNDERGYEQIRSPIRTWLDRTLGVDCDDYTVIIASILTVLKIPVILRVTQYDEEKGFQHIYPIVPVKGGYITMDAVMNAFNKEQLPIDKKIDRPMDLYFLNGVNKEDPFSSQDAEMGELGKGKITQALKNLSLKKVANAVNKVNPATVLLRNGVLAAMKINMMKVAGQLRWAYLSDEAAKKKGILMDRFQKLKTVRKKLEDIFYGAGGKPENLKAAILKGKGNRDKAVPLSGLSGLSYQEETSLMGHDQYTPLPELLGELYYDENGVGGTGELGDTGPAIVAATAAITAIATLLKGVGSLFPNGQAPPAEAGEEGTAAEADGMSFDDMLPVLQPKPTPKPAAQSKPVQINMGADFLKSLFPQQGLLPAAKPGLPALKSGSAATTIEPSTEEEGAAQQNTALQVMMNQGAPPPPQGSTPAIIQPETNATTGVAGWWEKNKKTVLIVGGVALGAGVIYLVAKNSGKNNGTNNLSGVPRKKNTGKKGGKKKGKSRGKKQARRVQLF